MSQCQCVIDILNHLPTGEISERGEEGRLLLQVQPTREELQRVEEGGEGGQGEEEGPGRGKRKGGA